MDMSAYLHEIRHACETILPAIWAEWDQVQALEGRIAVLRQQTEEGYRRSEAFQEFDNADDYMLGVGVHWDTYFGPDKERQYTEKELPEKTQLRDARAFACAAMAGSILQFAKQGMSQVHGGLDQCHSGRQIYGVGLKDIIWQGRNHALHWEESQPRRAVQECFDALAQTELAFAEYRSRNLSFEIVRLLGWRAVEQFEVDMMSLGGTDDG
jgi:hypothetical protein